MEREARSVGLSPDNPYFDFCGAESALSALPVSGVVFVVMMSLGIMASHHRRPAAQSQQ
jgi:hypothetical protein